MAMEYGGVVILGFYGRYVLLALPRCGDGATPLAPSPAAGL